MAAAFLARRSTEWTECGQVERMNRTIKEVTVKRFYYESHDQRRSHRADLVTAYNIAKRRLNTRKCLTPDQFISPAWTTRRAASLSTRSSKCWDETKQLVALHPLRCFRNRVGALRVLLNRTTSADSTSRVSTSDDQPCDRAAMLGTVLLIALILLLIGALPNWGYSGGWGYYPTGGGGLLLVIAIVLLLMGRM
jgi:Protein of unknown function (DUF3309)